MSRTWTVFTYKLRFFFGPSFRGRYGALVYLGLVLLFVPSGIGAGIALGTTVQGSSPDAAVAILSLPLAGVFSLALLYSLGTGVTAHVSEFDFLMTAELRPREYLRADLAFQFVTLLAAGGLAVVMSAFAMVLTLGRSALVALPLLGLLVGFAALVLMTSQVFVVARVRHPKRPVRTLTLVLIALSLIPAIPVVRPELPLRFADIPAPSTAFAYLGYAILTGAAVDPYWLGVVLVYTGLVAFAWMLASDAYIFHGIRPTLSAGFGQVDMTFKMEGQRRIIGGIGRATKRLRLRTDRGTDTGFMTRLHLLRIWRDGSILFVLLFAGIAFTPVLLGGGTGGTTAPAAVTQLLTFLAAVLAMNWSYYERENLWIVVTATGRPAAYFRGFLLSLAVVGVAVSAGFLLLFSGLSAPAFLFEDAVLPVTAAVGAAIAAGLLMTRVRIRPSSFSPAIFGLLFVVAVVGFLVGVGAQTVVRVTALVGSLGVPVQAVLVTAYTAALVGAALWGVTRLAAGFRL